MSQENAIGSVIEGLLAGVRKQQVAAVDAFADQAAVAAATAAIHAGKLADFDRALVRPTDEVVAGVLSRELPGNGRAQFLFAKHRFVSAQYRAVIEDIDGHGCSADRTRTVLRALMNHLAHGKPIVFDYTQEYTFHLPVRVFQTQESILTFFDAVYRLYHGSAEAYITSRATLYAEAAAMPPAVQ